MGEVTTTNLKRYTRTIKAADGTKIVKDVSTEYNVKLKTALKVYHCPECDAPVVFVESQRTGRKYMSNVMTTIRKWGGPAGRWRAFHVSFVPHSTTCTHTKESN